MSLLRQNRDDSPPQDAEALHQLAQQKVQAALAGLSQNTQSAQTAQAEPVRIGEQDPVILDAVERMQAHLSQLVAADQWGRPLSWAQVARLVIGPLADRMRDADTAGVLVEALTHPEQHDDGHSEHLRRRLLPLEGGGYRYVFAAETEEPSDEPAGQPAENHAEAHPETPADKQIVEQVHLAEERLLAALEHRYPQPQPRPHADRAVQGVGWPVH